MGPRTLGEHKVLGNPQTAIVPDGVAKATELTPRQEAYRDDIALIRDVVAGDRKAQKKLVLRVMPHLRAVARTLLGDSADTDDAVQVSLMKILRAAKDYRAEGSLERWARRIGVRTCLRIAKQERRHRQQVDRGTELSDVPASLPGPKLAERLPRHVQLYLDKIPETQRDALLLRHALDYSVAEIAELTAAPVDTVKSRLLFGRRALRKLVRQDLAIADAKSTMGPGSNGRGSDDTTSKGQKKHA